MANVTPISPNDFSTQLYESSDTSLISTFDVDTTLGADSYIEFFIYTLDRQILYSTNTYSSYKVENDSNSNSPTNINTFSVNPGEDVTKNGFNQGTVVAYYNFLTKRIGDPNSKLFISEISSDKTEIRLSSNILSSLDIKEQTNTFTSFRENSDYFVDFYLNFGGNNLVIANNIKLEDEDTSNPSILIKLYEPLPNGVELKRQLWIVTTLNESEAFEVNTPKQPITVQDSFKISGPNFNIPIKSEVNNSSQNLSYSDIITSPLFGNALTGSQNQIESLLSQSAINISVDYSNFNDFIHFSSAQTRIENFFYKASLIETYTSESGILNSITSSATSKNILDKKISNVIKNFDKFEYFMYYSSGSATSFPKQNDQKPYIPYSVTSSQALTWLGSEDVSNTYFGGLIESASNFDNANPDELKKSIPEYLRESSDNQMYDLFVDMVAQYYDGVWLYTKDITQKYNADNRLDFGVSKDLVADAIKDFGVKLYQNNFSNKELYTALLGTTPLGGTFPFPEMTPFSSSFTSSSFSTSTLISASATVYSSSITTPQLFYPPNYTQNVLYLKDISTNAGSINDFITLSPQLYLKDSSIGQKLFRRRGVDGSGLGWTANNDSIGIIDTSIPFENIISGSSTPAVKVYLTSSLYFSSGRDTTQSLPKTNLVFTSGGLAPGQTPLPNSSAIITNVGSTFISSSSSSSIVNTLSPIPQGMEGISDFISASNDVISMDDVNKSLYKRLYHNIPYLLKSKGTIAGLRALITSYGIPDTILRISEFGGKDKVNENDYDYYFNNFNYALDTTDNNSILIPWDVNKYFQIGPDTKPGTVEFRFQTPGIPNQSHVTQSLWFTNDSGNIDKTLVLEYTGSGLTSGSYSGSIPDPYREYGTLKYISNPGTANEVSCSVYLPFFDGGWWSVMVRNNGFANDIEYFADQAYDFDFIQSEDGKYLVNESANTNSQDNLGNINLFAANKLYNGNDGTSIGFKASASINDTNAYASWIGGNSSNGSVFCKGLPAFSSENFSGSIQEIRYYNVALGTTRFYDYTMNPLSIEGNKGTGGINRSKIPTPNSSPSELTFRASLGSELSITSSQIQSSIHPKVTGSWSYTNSSYQRFLVSGIPSFNSQDSLFTFAGTPSYVPNTEYFFLDQPAVGIKNRITDKIRLENDSIPSGDVLSSIRSLSQTTEASASYTENLNYLEVAFSPQNQINDDIIGQMGHFNVGDYIGDPAQRFSGNKYKDLNALSEEYFEKYIKQYDLVDFVRLIKFFDNSLFKMIKDFIPTRTSLASGLVIKQHLLERNKYPEPQMSFENKQYTGSIDMVAISGGAAGMVNPFNGLDTSPYGINGNGPTNRYGITQSWLENYPILSGSVTKIHDNQDEFYDGEFSGSLIDITNGELNVGCNWAKNPVNKLTNMKGVRIYDVTSSLGEYSLNYFLSLQNNPYNGYISLFNIAKTTSSFNPPDPSPPPPPVALVYNTPTTFELVGRRMQGTYPSQTPQYTNNTIPLYAQGTPTLIYKWDWNENSPLQYNNTVNFADQNQKTKPPAANFPAASGTYITNYEYYFIFKNQNGDIITGIEIEDMSVKNAALQELYGPNQRFTASMESSTNTSIKNIFNFNQFLRGIVSDQDLTRGPLNCNPGLGGTNNNTGYYGDVNITFKVKSTTLDGTGTNATTATGSSAYFTIPKIQALNSTGSGTVYSYGSNRPFFKTQSGNNGLSGGTSTSNLINNFFDGNTDSSQPISNPSTGHELFYNSYTSPSGDAGGTNVIGGGNQIITWSRASGNASSNSYNWGGVGGNYENGFQTSGNSTADPYYNARYKRVLLTGISGAGLNSVKPFVRFGGNQSFQNANIGNTSTNAIPFTDITSRTMTGGGSGNNFSDAFQLSLGTGGLLYLQATYKISNINAYNHYWIVFSLTKKSTSLNFTSGPSPTQWVTQLIYVSP